MASEDQLPGQDPSRPDGDGGDEGADEPALPTFVAEADELLQAARSMRDGNPEPQAYMRVQAIVRAPQSAIATPHTAATSPCCPADPPRPFPHLNHTLRFSASADCQVPGAAAAARPAPRRCGL